jgi:hypothetical protein
LTPIPSWRKLAALQLQFPGRGNEDDEERGSAVWYRTAGDLGDRLRWRPAQPNQAKNCAIPANGGKSYVWSAANSVTLEGGN